MRPGMLPLNGLPTPAQPNAVLTPNQSRSPPVRTKRTWRRTTSGWSLEVWLEALPSIAWKPSTAKAGSTTPSRPCQLESIFIAWLNWTIPFSSWLEELQPTRTPPDTPSHMTTVTTAGPRARNLPSLEAVTPAESSVPSTQRRAKMKRWSSWPADRPERTTLPLSRSSASALKGQSVTSGRLDQHCPRMFCLALWFSTSKI